MMHRISEEGKIDLSGRVFAFSRTSNILALADRLSMHADLRLLDLSFTNLTDSDLEMILNSFLQRQMAHQKLLSQWMPGCLASLCVDYLIPILILKLNDTCLTDACLPILLRLQDHRCKIVFWRAEFCSLSTLALFSRENMTEK